MLDSNRQQLKEIKKGEIGTGLLIENDGYITMREGNNKLLYESIVSSNNKDYAYDLPRPFIVDAVFQKYDIENANGRIYPKKVLQREVEKYQMKIKNRNAFGECYKPDTLILTKYGWKTLAEAKVGDEVVTLNPLTNDIEIHPISNKIEYEYDGDMIRITGENIDDLVTPNHGYPIYDKNKNFKGFFTAEDILNKSIPDQNNCYIPKYGEWNEIGDDYFMLGNKRIPMNLFMEFIGIYLSNGDYDDNTIKIYHKNESVCESISKLLDSIGFDYSIDVKDYGLKAFVIVNSDLNEYIKSLGDSKNKCIPPILKNQSKENLEMLFDWFLIGSEVITNDLPQSEQLTLDLDEIRFKIGFFADVYLHEEKISIGKEHYKGTVMCVEVPNHVWCCMCNSNIHWTKNCNHPAETVIDLDRIAINIIELHWEGNTLVGKMEIPVSEGFRRFGIISTRADQVAYLILSDLLIGVSSRGLGSVEKVMGKLIVKDDYEIICWDVVSDPSTPNAYIVKNKEQLSLYIEDNAKKGNVLIEKLEKFNNWLTLRD